MILKCKNNHVLTDEVRDKYGRPLPKFGVRRRRRRENIQYIIKPSR